MASNRPIAPELTSPTRARTSQRGPTRVVSSRTESATVHQPVISSLPGTRELQSSAPAGSRPRGGAPRLRRDISRRPPPAGAARQALLGWAGSAILQRVPEEGSAGARRERRGAARLPATAQRPAAWPHREVQCGCPGEHADPLRSARGCACWESGLSQRLHLDQLWFAYPAVCGQAHERDAVRRRSSARLGG